MNFIFTWRAGPVNSTGRARSAPNGPSNPMRTARKAQYLDIVFIK